MSEKQTTIEDLAVMVKKGFEDTARKQDVVGLKGDITGLKEDVTGLKEDMIEVKEGLDHVDARLGRIEADINEMRGEIVYRHEFEDALGRIKYLEKKLGIESGV